MVNFFPEFPASPKLKLHPPLYKTFYCSFKHANRLTSAWSHDYWKVRNMYLYAYCFYERRQNEQEPRKRKTCRKF